VQYQLAISAVKNLAEVKRVKVKNWHGFSGIHRPQSGNVTPGRCPEYSWLTKHGRLDIRWHPFGALQATGVDIPPGARLCPNEALHVCIDGVKWMISRSRLKAWTATSTDTRILAAAAIPSTSDPCGRSIRLGNNTPGAGLRTIVSNPSGFVQRDSHKRSDGQRVTSSPGDPSLTINSFEVAYQ
jgi:hypothetical protein